MNHTSVVLNGTVHQSLLELNRAAGRTYTLGETNSVSGQGAFGVSNVFGSALFIVDYELYYASFVGSSRYYSIMEYKSNSNV
jgi:hypothetical protein